MKTANKLYTNIPTTVFSVMSALANEHGAVNLGQGFPDTDGPAWIREIAAKAIIDGPNQYPPMFGVPALRQAVADANKRFYGLEINPGTEVMVTSGATEALMDCCLALLNPGDEAIVIEPFYDSYPLQIQTAGATPRYVRLDAPDWTLDEKKLRATFSDKTKLLMLNSPLNPAAKVFSKEELELIAKLLIEYDAYAVCDEVYEHLIFDGDKHIPLMSLPGMRERCIRIGSAGKTFSLTGWKVGYITACPALLKAIAGAHQYVTFTTPPALQLAIAEGLNADDSYYQELTAQMDEGRKILTDGLEKLGFNILPCAGTYFLTVDFLPLGFDGGDYAFCEYLTKEAGVTAIPMSPFYAEENGPAPQNLIRFCFAKKREVLEEALSRLEKFFSGKQVTSAL
ncbi:MAG: aminotransferase [Rhodospirillales bacterium]|nr:aminotransferase [Rhodospirillales bacterium]MCB9995350.1 aminotransferase [Rhodospirillales bacterium]